MATKIGTKTVLGVELVVEADPSGTFWLREQPGEDGGQGKIMGSAESLKGAVAKARTELKKRDVTVSVPFTFADGRRATAYGIHAGNGQILIEFSDGTKDSITSGVGRQSAFRPDMADEDIARLKELRDQETSVRSEIRRIETKWKLDMGLDHVVRRAIDRAAEAAAAA